MRRFGWRLLFVVAFLPLGLLTLWWCAGVIMAAAVVWLLRGPDVRDGRDRAERWMLGRVGRMLDWPLDRLMRKAGVLRELWT